MNTILIDGRKIAYRDVGEGSPVILAHCSSASHRQWSALIPHLATRYRVLAPDLIGYGRSSRWPEDTPFDPAADANVLLALAELAGSPLHLIGHSYGGAVALETARLLGNLSTNDAGVPWVKSLTLIEPVAFHVLRLAERSAEWDEISTVARRVRELAFAASYDKAAASYMKFWIGGLRWRLMPRKQRVRIVETVLKVAHEFGIIDQLTTTLADYAQIDAPTRFISGQNTREPAKAVTEVLAGTLPNAEQREVPNAGHMSPFTHAAEVHTLITWHVDAVESASGAG